ncbi:GAF domain-containing protein [Pantanalinema rosaneae CENA516]|uniref:sensor histidine kinase n=1 Tax=Pantanalinema rosaneae TaxID=1620701 RepID=UPI003D6EF4A8
MKVELAIAQIGIKIHQSQLLKPLLETAVTEVRQFLQVDRVLIWRLRQKWRGSVAVESVAPDWKSLLGKSVADACLLKSQGEPNSPASITAIADIQTADLSPHQRRVLTNLQAQAVLIVPIPRGSAPLDLVTEAAHPPIWGLLVAHHCQAPRVWHSYEIQGLRQLAEQIGIAIAQADFFQQQQRLNANLERQIQKRSAQLQLASEFEATLKRLTDRVRDSLNEDQILQTAVREVAITTGAIGCNASLYDLERRTSTIRYEYTNDLAPFQGRIVKMNNYPEGYEQLLRGQYFQFCSLLPNPVRGQVAMLACPILDDQGVLGDLWLISQSYHAFNEQDIRLVQQVANQCAIAIRQARLYQKAQAQVAELEKLNRLKDDFLSTVSHELRTPMSNIKLATQMLEIHLQRLNLFDQAHPLTKYFRILNAECQREINLINDLLDLSRLESKHEPLNLMPVALQTWIPFHVQPFIERAHSQNQELQVQVANTLPPLITDPHCLERILSELLNNACKYTPAHEQITVSAVATPDRIQLQVSNSGVEISATELDRVFDKFYRIPNNDPWRHGGTGLGLALVKKLVETLNGRIEASSRNRLTCFMVELPIKSDLELAPITSRSL